MKFKFCTPIYRLNRNKSPLKISGKVAVGRVRDSRKFSGHLYIWCIAWSSLRAIAQLSCSVILFIHCLLHAVMHKHFLSVTVGQIISVCTIMWTKSYTNVCCYLTSDQSDFVVFSLTYITNVYAYHHCSLWVKCEMFYVVEFPDGSVEVVPAVITSR